MTRTPLRRARAAALLLAVPLVAGTIPLAANAGAADIADSSAVDTLAQSLQEPDLVAIVVGDEKEVDTLDSLGVDLAHYKKPVADGIEIHAMLTDSEKAQLKTLGFDVRGAVVTDEQMDAVTEERAETVQRLAAAEAAVDTDELNVLRAEWFTSIGGQTFLSTEVRSTLGADADTVITASWEGGSVTLNRFVDAGVYMYHRMTQPVAISSVPETITFTSSMGDVETVPVTKWLGGPLSAPQPHLATGFVDHYMDPTEVMARIEALAAEFPELAEIITLPNKSNGYRRQAQVIVGSTQSDALNGTFYVTSKAWGHEGGNNLGVTIVKSAAASSPLTLSVSGNDVTVNLATNAAGDATSTGSEVVAAINGSAEASALLTASLYRSATGAGVVAPAARAALTDSLAAPASVSRDPFTLKAIRIGKVRDGSKTGIYAYSQEHAREWVTPLVSLETAERLLRNYSTDAATRNLVDNLDIFIQPVVNPDGAHYSMYDRNGQRRNMTNYCGPADGDPGRRGNWGVDLNRNFTVGSAHDGYDGASTTNCRSDTYAGPAELSEPEARNEVWMTEQHPNIKFSMNVHSYGGYFMWAPGAYIEEGRIPLPRPSFGTEAYFWQASDHILQRVQSWRGTATWPGRSGPIIDVLYSAAGNSGDEHYYNKDIYAWTFEVGADLWNPATQRWQAVGFQPPFAEGYQEAMEFSSGLIGMFEVAKNFQDDKTGPESHLVVKSRTASSTTFSFETSEPATVYYTLDGSNPTKASTQLQNAGIRDEPETFTVSNGTVVKWFAIDAKGNVENGYVEGGALPTYEVFSVVAGGNAYDDLESTLGFYVSDDRIPSRVADQLRDRLLRAEAMAATGSEVRTIGLLKELIAKANNQIKGDAADVIARNAIVDAAQALIDVLQAAEDAENAPAR